MLSSYPAVAKYSCQTGNNGRPCDHIYTRMSVMTGIGEINVFGAQLWQKNICNLLTWWYWVGLVEEYLRLVWVLVVDEVDIHAISAFIFIFLQSFLLRNAFFLMSTLFSKCSTARVMQVLNTAMHWHFR